MDPRGWSVKSVKYIWSAMVPVGVTKEEGQTVQFEVTKGPKGWQAENVQPL